MTFLLNEVINTGGAFMVNQHTLEYSRALYLITGTDFPLVLIPER